MLHKVGEGIIIFHYFISMTVLVFKFYQFILLKNSKSNPILDQQLISYELGV